ncbi:MAG: hypothetical protein A4E71_01963 [Smithella sp. PtaU1.Bin162]|nr:MAG: hypothetical protein A4E71_01963 [Smithella sp. PtaU1.Bin162]
MTLNCQNLNNFRGMRTFMDWDIYCQSVLIGEGTVPEAIKKSPNTRGITLIYYNDSKRRYVL